MRSGALAVELIAECSEIGGVDTGGRGGDLEDAVFDVAEPALLLLALAVARELGVALAAVLGLAGISLGATLGRSFLPRLDEGTMVITMVRLPSVSLAQSTALTTHVERILRGFPEVRTVVSRTGRAEIAVDPMGVNMTDVYVMLKPRAEWRTAHDREGLLAAFDHALSTQVPGTGFAFTQPRIEDALRVALAA